MSKYLDSKYFDTKETSGSTFDEVKLVLNRLNRLERVTCGIVCGYIVLFCNCAVTAKIFLYFKKT